jgi:aspartate/methionine/tyrosine aminotransferase
MLYEGGVALLAGTAFGQAGKGYLRLSFANSIEQIEEGVRRMKGVLDKQPATA